MSQNSTDETLIIGADHVGAGLEAAARADGPGLTVAQQATLAFIAGTLRDKQVDPDVLCAPDEEIASLFQAFMEEQAREQQLPANPVAAGGREVKFDDRDFAGWATVFFAWAGSIRKHDWVAPPATPTPLADDARIGVLGDWGSGLYGAPVIAKTIEKDARPFDLLVHLGDIYYAGTSDAVKRRFLRYWPKRPEAKSRACNGNHEMYAGANAYFDLILEQFGQKGSPFALTNDHWLVVGLDTAFKDHQLSHGQTSWLQQLLEHAERRRLLLLTHHQPYSLEKQGNKLVEQLLPLLQSKKVAAWYWGHEHRCVLFDQHRDWGVWGRCIGHSGYPYFRDKLHGTEQAQVHGHRLVRVNGKDGVPSALVLDGANPYVKGKEKDYGPQGYVTIELKGPRLIEHVHSPDGTELHQMELRWT